MASKVLYGRTNYAFLTKPRKPDEGQGEATYQVQLAIPKKGKGSEQISPFKKEIAEIAMAEFGKTATDLIKKGKLAIPLRDGDEMEGEQFKGFWVVGMRRKESFGAPQVVDSAVNPITDPTEIYSGMWANVSYALFGYNVSGKRGIGCGLQNVQKVKDDERLGGGSAAKDDFTPLEEESGGEQGDDDIPF